MNGYMVAALLFVLALALAVWGAHTGSWRVEDALGPIVPLLFFVSISIALVTLVVRDDRAHDDRAHCERLGRLARTHADTVLVAVESGCLPGEGGR